MPISEPASRMRRVGLGLSVAITIALAACDVGTLPTPAAEINPPSIAGYTRYDGKDIIQKGVSANNVLAFIFRSDPRFQVAANLVANLTTCASDRGIARFAAYKNDSDPLAAGIILIVSKTKLADGRVLLSCITPAAQTSSGISPCQKAYDFTANGENFWAYYGATKESVCADFATTLPAASPLFLSRPIKKTPTKSRPNPTKPNRICPPCWYDMGVFRRGPEQIAPAGSSPFNTT